MKTAILTFALAFCGLALPGPVSAQCCCNERGGACPCCPCCPGYQGQAAFQAPVFQGGGCRGGSYQGPVAAYPVAAPRAACPTCPTCPGGQPRQAYPAPACQPVFPQGAPRGSLRGAPYVEETRFSVGPSGAPFVVETRRFEPAPQGPVVAEVRGSFQGTVTIPPPPPAAGPVYTGRPCVASRTAPRSPYDFLPPCAACQGGYCPGRPR